MTIKSISISRVESSPEIEYKLELFVSTAAIPNVSGVFTSEKDDFTLITERYILPRSMYNEFRTSTRIMDYRKIEMYAAVKLFSQVKNTIDKQYF